MGLLGALFGSNKTNERLKELLSQGAVIIDVRTPAEFKRGHAKGAQNIPLQSIEGKAGKIKKLNKPVILCCASGNRSGQATSILKKKGIAAENGGAWTSVRKLVG